MKEHEHDQPCGECADETRDEPAQLTERTRVSLGLGSWVGIITAAGTCVGCLLGLVYVSARAAEATEQRVGRVESRVEELKTDLKDDIREIRADIKTLLRRTP